MEYVLLDFKKEGYAAITLNRPEKMNAVNKQMVVELHNTLSKVRQASNLKFVTITGAGEQAFCAGGDLKEFHGDLSAEEAFELLNPMKEFVYLLSTLPVPTIALLNGQALGGGCEIATACDFRYGIDSASFGFVQGNLGITPGWGGGALLYKRISPDLAAHWLMDSQMYNCDKSLQIGWLHKKCTRGELKSKDLFYSFLNKTPQQMKWFKHQYLTSISTDLQQDMDDEVKNCSSLWESEAHKIAVQTFMDSRKN